jgi:hypothetical protein
MSFEVSIKFPVDNSHIFISLSNELVTTYFPSGDIKTDKIMNVCPSSVLTRFPVAISHTLIDLSLEPATRSNT